MPPVIPRPVPACRLAIFDFDGTLADTFPWFCGVLNEVARRYAFRQVAPDEVERLRGLDARALLHDLGIPRWKLPFIARHMRRRAARERDAFRLVEGMGDALERLAAGGVMLAVVSSNAEATVRHVLGPRHGALVRHYSCGAALFGKAERFRRLLRREGIAPREAICIADETRDLDAARRIGIAFAGVAWGYMRADVLAAAGPDLMFHAPAEIAPRLLRSSAAAGGS